MTSVVAAFHTETCSSSSSSVVFGAFNPQLRHKPCNAAPSPNVSQLSVRSSSSKATEPNTKQALQSRSSSSSSSSSHTPSCFNSTASVLLSEPATTTTASKKKNVAAAAAAANNNKKKKSPMVVQTHAAAAAVQPTTIAAGKRQNAAPALAAQSPAKEVLGSSTGNKKEQQQQQQQKLNGALLSNSPDEYERMLMNLIDQLQGIRLHALALERWHAPQLKNVHRRYQQSARNLLHYVAFRSLDIAGLQETLTSLGLSSLDNCEASTIASVNSVISSLRSLLYAAQLDSSRFFLAAEGVTGAAGPGAPNAIGITSHLSTKNSRATAAEESDAATAFGDQWTSKLSSEMLQCATSQAELEWPPMTMAMAAQGDKLLCSNAQELLGPLSTKGSRETHIMVTLPSESALEDDALIQALIKAGMNVARVNCAHDGPETWLKMIRKVRYFSQLLESPCRVMMDLAGPKVRTGPMRPGPSVLKLKPSKDETGDVLTPATVWIANEGIKPPPSPTRTTEDLEQEASDNKSTATRVASASIPIKEEAQKWLKKVAVGDMLKFKDRKGRQRALVVVAKETAAAGVWAECNETSYVETGTEFALVGTRSGAKKARIHVGELPKIEQAIVLRTGDKLVLTKLPEKQEQECQDDDDETLPNFIKKRTQRQKEQEKEQKGNNNENKLGVFLGTPAVLDKAGNVIEPARIACTLPQVFDAAKVGDPIMFDEGKIAGKIAAVSSAGDEILVEITDAGDSDGLQKGRKLRGEKAINLPQTDLAVCGLTAKDATDLEFVAAHADIVALSFVNGPSDVLCLQQKLRHIQEKQQTSDSQCSSQNSLGGKHGSSSSSSQNSLGGKQKSSSSSLQNSLRGKERSSSSLQNESLGGKQGSSSSSLENSLGGRHGSSSSLQKISLGAMGQGSCSLSSQNALGALGQGSFSSSSFSSSSLGIVLKIETELGFQRLPAILLQAMETENSLGVMVARGDMAVECGWQRLAEMQDQILVTGEAAHVPTIWATQVLEGMAKSGIPSRAEITDAASASRAECVMLNKGPHIMEAVNSLDEILCREACHRRKNHAIMHPLSHFQSYH